MTTTLELDPTLLEKPTKVNQLHFLPCHVIEDASNLPVDSRFAAFTADQGSGQLTNQLRGRPLDGAVTSLPDGYTGLVVEGRQGLLANQDKTLRLAHQRTHLFVQQSVMKIFEYSNIFDTNIRIFIRIKILIKRNSDIGLWEFYRKLNFWNTIFDTQIYLFGYLIDVNLIQGNSKLPSLHNVELWQEANRGRCLVKGCQVDWSCCSSAWRLILNKTRLFLVVCNIRLLLISLAVMDKTRLFWAFCTCFRSSLPVTNLQTCPKSWECWSSSLASGGCIMLLI